MPIHRRLSLLATLALVLGVFPAASEAAASRAEATRPVSAISRAATAVPTATAGVSEVARHRKDHGHKTHYRPKPSSKPTPKPAKSQVFFVLVNLRQAREGVSWHTELPLLFVKKKHLITFHFYRCAPKSEFTPGCDVRPVVPRGSVHAPPGGGVFPRRVQARRSRGVRDLRVVRNALRFELCDVRASFGGRFLGHEERERAVVSRAAVLERDRHRGGEHVAVRIAERGGHEAGECPGKHAVLVLALPVTGGVDSPRRDRVGEAESGIFPHMRRRRRARRGERVGVHQVLERRAN